MKKLLYLVLCLSMLTAMACPMAAIALMPEDGLYAVGVQSSSKMFRVADARLEVSDGRMTAHLTLSSDSYGYLFPGTLDAANTAPKDAWIAPQDDTQAQYTFLVPIKALDAPVNVAAWSKKYEKWYERQLTFLSGSLRKLDIPDEKPAAATPKDGQYSIAVTADSPLFAADAAALTVRGGSMTLTLPVKDSRYGALYLGLAKEATLQGKGAQLPIKTDAAGASYVSFGLENLDAPIRLATYSDKKGLWYDRTLTLHPDTLTPLEQVGLPSFAFDGGSGRTTISLVAFDPAAQTATIEFSSHSYTEVKLNGAVYPNENPNGNARFTFPIQINGATAISAQTTAMSKPRWIDYTLYLYTDGTDATTLIPPKAPKKETSRQAPSFDALPQAEGVRFGEAIPLQYAKNFQIFNSDEGYALLQTANGRNYLIVPPNLPEPKVQSGKVTLLKQPLNHIYLGASSAMAMVDGLNALDAVALSGTKEENWSIPAAKNAMREGRIRYAGKYSAPDYELLLSCGVSLTVQSTMILQAPEVEEKLAALRIPLLIDLSSLESHPLGRTEWIKVYGLLLDRREEAQTAFDAQQALLEALAPSKQRPTAAYFYFNSSGAVVTKAKEDYFPTLLELSGASYLGPNSKTKDTASVNMDMESFFALAKDADILIYNAATGTVPESLNELKNRHELFAAFRAVENGQVYVANNTLYQSPHRLGEAAHLLHRIFDGENPLPQNDLIGKLQ